MEEVKKYGDVTLRRMYGSFSGSKLGEWEKKALDFAIVPIHQSIYTTGKNAADIMLVIDAMDIMFQNHVDAFCLVSSDSDFTRLANRLRESGKTVIGMGKSDASKSFIAACNEYKYLDKIMDDEVEEEGENQSSTITPLKNIKVSINKIVQQAENKGEHANMGSTKSIIQRQYPDFDERNYGYTLFRKLIEEETKFKILQEGSVAYIVRDSAENIESKVAEYIVNLAAKQKIELGKLGQQLCANYPMFKYKDSGFSTLKKYVSSIKEVKVENGKKNKVYVVIK